MNGAMTRRKGYVCPVRGCKNKHNRRFTALGITQHLLSEHHGEFQKRLKLKEEWKK
jgi:hypothetical protein